MYLVDKTELHILQFIIKKMKNRKTWSEAHIHCWGVNMHFGVITLMVTIWRSHGINWTSHTTVFFCLKLYILVLLHQITYKHNYFVQLFSNFEVHKMVRVHPHTFSSYVHASNRSHVCTPIQLEHMTIWPIASIYELTSY